MDSIQTEYTTEIAPAQSFVQVETTIHTALRFACFYKTIVVFEYAVNNSASGTNDSTNYIGPPVCEESESERKWFYLRYIHL